MKYPQAIPPIGNRTILSAKTDDDCLLPPITIGKNKLNNTAVPTPHKRTPYFRIKFHFPLALSFSHFSNLLLIVVLRTGAISGRPSTLPYRWTLSAV